jgi:hypothetical protein
MVRTPIQQCVSGRSGALALTLIEKKSMSLPNFQKMAAKHTNGGMYFSFRFLEVGQ